MNDDAMQVYVVRVWRHDGLLRASVRRPGSDETRCFSAPQALGQYLCNPAADDRPGTDGGQDVTRTKD